MTLFDIQNKVVIPALLAIESYSLAAEQLVMATGMAESLFQATRQVVRYKPKIIHGPARGYFQMEPFTHDDLWRGYIGATRRAHLLEGLRKLSDHPGDPEELVRNQPYAAAMCRIFYLRIPAPLPREGDWNGMAAYWKQYYNTPRGKGTAAGFLKKAEPVFALYERRVS